MRFCGLGLRLQGFGLGFRVLSRLRLHGLHREVVFHECRVVTISLVRVSKQIDCGLQMFIARLLCCIGFCGGLVTD